MYTHPLARATGMMPLIAGKIRTAIREILVTEMSCAEPKTEERQPAADLFEQRITRLELL